MAVDGALLERELKGLDALAAALPQKRSRGRRAWAATWPPVMAAAMFLLFWQIVVWTHWRPETVLPSPFTVLKSLSGDLGVISKATARTLFRGAKGLAVAVV